MAAQALAKAATSPVAALGVGGQAWQWLWRRGEQVWVVAARSAGVNPTVAWAVEASDSPSGWKKSAVMSSNKHCKCMTKKYHLQLLNSSQAFVLCLGRRILIR